MKASRAYYRSVGKYHDMAEASHADQMIDATLIAPYVAVNDWVLDMGAGTGFNAELLHIPAGYYVAADLSVRGLSQVVTRNRGHATVSDVGRLPFRDGAFASVLCSWSLEHFDEPQRVLDEMIRVAKPNGRIIIWGPNWDNVFRKDFPQFVHKTRWYVTRARWTIFFRMMKNEFLPFAYRPYVNTDVAAFRFPERFISADTDATHCVLCQETYHYFVAKRCRPLFMGDFTMMRKHVHNDPFIRAVRSVVKPFLPFLKKMPLLRWFVACFPIVIQVPTVNRGE